MERRGYISLLFAALLTVGGCGYNDFDEADEIVLTPYETVYPNETIGSLVSHHKDKPLNISHDIIIRGIVTANDRSDNFYRTFIIQDASGAIEVRAGIFDLHNIFPLGRYVAIKTQGLVLDKYNSVAQLGLAPSDGSLQAGYIATRFYPGGYFFPQDENGDIEPLTLGVGDLTDDKCGLLVRVENLVFTPGELVDEYITWADDGANGYRTFRDDAGREVTVVTSGYANFSGKQVPKGKISLTGILMKGNTDKAYGVYMLKLRSIEDVGM